MVWNVAVIGIIQSQSAAIAEGEIELRHVDAMAFYRELQVIALRHVDAMAFYRAIPQILEISGMDSFVILKPSGNQVSGLDSFVIVKPGQQIAAQVGSYVFMRDQ